MMALLLRYGIPVALQILTKLGFINWAERIAIKAGYSVVEAVEGLKTYSAPTDFPKQHDKFGG